jgi:hypothetical protein
MSSWRGSFLLFPVVTSSLLDPQHVYHRQKLKVKIVKNNVTLSFPLNEDITTWDADVKLHKFLTLSLEGGSQLHVPAALPAGNNSITHWVSHCDSSDVLEKTEIPWPFNLEVSNVGSLISHSTRIARLGEKHSVRESVTEGRDFAYKSVPHGSSGSRRRTRGVRTKKSMTHQNRPLHNAHKHWRKNTLRGVHRLFHYLASVDY